MESSHHVIAITNIVEDNNNNNNVASSMKGNDNKALPLSLPPPPVVSHVKKNNESSIFPISSNDDVVKEEKQKEKKKKKKKKKKSLNDTRKMIHSIKVGISLVLVSLIYLLNPLFEQVGENAMWAIMTVIVTFEFSAGATLGKGFNRGMGTIMGGILGCLAAVFAQWIGGAGNSIVIASSVFIFGSIATYFRLNPRIKKRYDYGMMIFILTFNLVVVSGARGDVKVWELARERLLTILMGFIVCICVSLFVFPLWASDELHDSIVSRFLDLSNTIQGCLGEYSEKENQAGGATFTSVCKSVLNSKSKDELLANFAKWEPWHGKFGFSYPWEKYLKIGDSLGELATFILAVGHCLQSSKEVGINLYCKTTKQTNSSPTTLGSLLGSMDHYDQPIESLKHSNISLQLETFEAIESRIAWTLRELGESIKHMRKCKGESNILDQLKVAKAELNSIFPNSKREELEDCEVLAIASFVFLLLQVVEKVEELVKQVEELGEIARFRARETS